MIVFETFESAFRVTLWSTLPYILIGSHIVVPDGKIRYWFIESSVFYERSLTTGIDGKN